MTEWSFGARDSLIDGGQVDDVFTPLFSCLSRIWRKAHELCLVFILWNYIRLNVPQQGRGRVMTAAFPAHLQSIQCFLN